MRINGTLATNLILITAVVLLLGARGGQEIYDVRDKSVPATASHLSLTQMEGQIVSSGVRLGWQMGRVKPGVPRGTIRQKKRVATVKIVHDTKTYSILYDSSRNLAEAVNTQGVRTIHKRYNNYVIRLDRKFAKTLASAASIPSRQFASKPVVSCASPVVQQHLNSPRYVSRSVQNDTEEELEF